MAGSRHITQAVIPVAGRGRRLYPASLAAPKCLMPLVDADGIARPVIHMILRAAVAGGIERVALVVSPEHEPLLRRYFSGRYRDELTRIGKAEIADELAALGERLTYLAAPSPEGFGHAVWLTRDWAAGEPVLVMLGDTVIVPALGVKPPVGQLLEHFGRFDAVGVIGAAVTPADGVHLCGTLAGEPIETDSSVYRITNLMEKPSPEQARRSLRTPGLAGDRFLTHFGLYAFSPEVFDALDELVRANRREGGEIQLTSAEALLVGRGRDLLAAVLAGRAMDVGTGEGLAGTQAAIRR